MKYLNLVFVFLLFLMVFGLSESSGGCPLRFLSLSVHNHQTYYNAFPTAPLMMMFLEQLKSFVEANLSKSDLNVRMLEKEMGMNRTNIHRKISVSTHMSATAFIRFIRLTKACQLLRGDKDKTISQIAKEVGFSSLSYFTRCFHKLFGMSPTDWRNQGFS